MDSYIFLKNEYYCKQVESSKKFTGFPCFVSFSILNKLTPEKFDKLCLELLNVGVESKLILKGIILLVRKYISFVGGMLI